MQFVCGFTMFHSLVRIQRGKPSPEAPRHVTHVTHVTVTIWEFWDLDISWLYLLTCLTASPASHTQNPPFCSMYLHVHLNSFSFNSMLDEAMKQVLEDHALHETSESECWPGVNQTKMQTIAKEKMNRLKQLNSLDLHGITPWRFQDPAALNAAWRCLEKSPCGARRAVFLLGRIQLKRGPCNMWPYDTLQRGSRFNSWSSSEKEWVGKNGISKALPLCGCSSHSINYLALMIACCSGSIRNI
jgi:hypothetical protein